MSTPPAPQAMLIFGQLRSSQIATCLAAASDFHLSADQAIAIVADQFETIAAHWRPLCAEANLGQVERTFFWGRQFLNPYAFYGLEGASSLIADRATAIRAEL